MSVLLVVGAVLSTLGVFAMVYMTARNRKSALRYVLRRYVGLLTEHAEFLLLRRSGSDIARVQVAIVLAFAVLFCATEHAFLALGAGLGAVGPPLVLRSRHRKRVAVLERQLDAWLLMLANALKSTASAGDAVASTLALVPRPFSEEVGLIIKELRLGISFDRAIRAAGRRIGSPTVSGAFMLLLVARRSGGDLSSTLARAGEGLRETARLEGVLRTKTAEGRGQVLVLALVPFILCFVIGSLDASWFEPMLYDSYGRAILALCATLWCVAVAWAHRIVGTAL